MFQIAPGVRVIAYLVFGVIGLVTGALAGVLFSVVLKVRIGGIAVDAVLGATGFLIMWFAITMTRYQHPFVAAMIPAVVLPALHQFFRWRNWTR